MLDTNKIYNIDCIEGMKQIDSNCIDTIITDPPYNISQAGLQLKRNFGKSRKYKRDSNINLDFGKWDLFEEKEYKTFTEKWFKECLRVLKKDGWFFSFFPTERFGYFIDPLDGLFIKYGFKTRTVISWHKTNPVPNYRRWNFLSSCEFVIVGSKGSSKIQNFSHQNNMHNFYETPNSSIYGKTNHPTEKPIILIQWLVKISSNENQIILDPFMGSGTTAVACKQLHRRFIGFEISPDYCNIANKRLKETRISKSLFEI